MERGIVSCEISLQLHSKPDAGSAGPCSPKLPTRTQNVAQSAASSLAGPSADGKHTQSGGERSPGMTSLTCGHLAANECGHSRTCYARGWSQFLGCNEAAVMSVSITLI